MAEVCRMLTTVFGEVHRWVAALCNTWPCSCAVFFFSHFCEGIRSHNKCLWSYCFWWIDVRETWPKSLAALPSVHPLRIYSAKQTWITVFWTKKVCYFCLANRELATHARFQVLGIPCLPEIVKFIGENLWCLLFEFNWLCFILCRLFIGLFTLWESTGCSFQCISQQWERTAGPGVCAVLPSSAVPPRSRQQQQQCLQCWQPRQCLALVAACQWRDVRGTSAAAVRRKQGKLSCLFFSSDLCMCMFPLRCLFKFDAPYSTFMYVLVQNRQMMFVQ